MKIKGVDKNLRMGNFIENPKIKGDQNLREYVMVLEIHNLRTIHTDLSAGEPISSA